MWKITYKRSATRRIKYRDHATSHENWWTKTLKEISEKIPFPNAAVISTHKKFITFLKLRLEFVATGEFSIPNKEISDPLEVES